VKIVSVDDEAGFWEDRDVVRACLLESPPRVLVHQAPGLTVLRTRSDTTKDIEILVLRHQLAVH
jgi:hypothetical protein